ncbi:tetratricopeptide repeat protein [Lignipirellula cremea]|uniref:Tetratricopeptide repeat protein n=1 Tax=Lignipirellula cremea TaxID=2528010 RepID=A0A518DUG8_9BACT|nr:hypothetical protein [Lignipirellula cremea]QDU95481.1 Tetratricopeptide repeat protein [Lignipirellula cremea]
MEVWQHRFENHMSDGEMRFGGQDYEGARLYFQDAFKIVPEPKREYHETTRAITALADCFYHLKDYSKAQAALDDVEACPGGAANPFVQLRRGQVAQLLGNTEQARIELTTAYLNGGRELFEGEDEYLDLIADVVAELE